MFLTSLGLGLGDEGAAEVEPSRARLGQGPGYVRLDAARADEVADLVAAGVEQLGDQPAGALRPRRLGAHQRWLGFGEGRREALLPAGRAHPRRIGTEGRHADAVEPLLAGLVAEPPAELDHVPV